MIRNLKALGLVLVAVFAMSALVASAASAAQGTLTLFPPKNNGAVPTAEQTGEHEFTLTDHPISGGFAITKCKKATFLGTAAVAAGATAMNVTPAYSECAAFGQPATITTTGCTYKLTIGEFAGGSAPVTTDVVCTGGAVIKIVTGTCEVTVGAQTGLVSSSVTNSGAGTPETAMDLLQHTNITGIKYTVVKDSIGCPLSGTGSFSKGDYTGTTTMKAHDHVTGAALGMTVH